MWCAQGCPARLSAPKLAPAPHCWPRPSAWPRFAALCAKIDFLSRPSAPSPTVCIEVSALAASAVAKADPEHPLENVRCKTDKTGLVETTPQSGRKRPWLFSVVAVAALLGACDGAPVDQTAGEVTTGEDVNALSPDVTPRWCHDQRAAPPAARDEKTCAATAKPPAGQRGSRAQERHARHVLWNGQLAPKQPTPAAMRSRRRLLLRLLLPGMCFYRVAQRSDGTCVDDST